MAVLTPGNNGLCHNWSGIAYALQLTPSNSARHVYPINLIYLPSSRRNLERNVGKFSCAAVRYRNRFLKGCGLHFYLALKRKSSECCYIRLATYHVHLDLFSAHDFVGQRVICYRLSMHIFYSSIGSPSKLKAEFQPSTKCNREHAPRTYSNTWNVLP